MRYFAILREQRGLGAERVSTGAATARALYDELRGRHGFSLPAGRVRVAINGDFTGWDAPVREGDELVFMPPIAGG